METEPKEKQKLEDSQDEFKLLAVVCLLYTLGLIFYIFITASISPQSNFFGYYIQLFFSTVFFFYFTIKSRAGRFKAVMMVFFGLILLLVFLMYVVWSFRDGLFTPKGEDPW